MSVPSCCVCGRDVFKAALYRATDTGALPPGKWACQSCGGRPPNREVERIVNAIAAPAPRDEGDGR